MRTQSLFVAAFVLGCAGPKKADPTAAAVSVSAPAPNPTTEAPTAPKQTAGPPPPAEPKPTILRDGPRVYAKTRFVWIHSEPGAAGWIGFLWFGGSVKLKQAEPVNGPGCTKWVAIEPRGYVCADGQRATLDPDDPQLQRIVPYAPNVASAWPHHYAESRGAYRYPELPSAEQQRAHEWDLPDHLARIARAKEGKQPLPESLVGVDLSPAPATPIDLGTLPPTVRESRQRMLPLSTVAYSAEVLSGDRSYLLTADLMWLPKDRVVPYPKVTFRGVHLGKDAKLPLAFFRSEDRPKYKKSSEGTLAEAGTKWSRLAYVELTGKSLEQAGDTFLETREPGLWVKQSDAVVPTPQESTPWGAQGGRAGHERRAGRPAYVARGQRVEGLAHRLRGNQAGVRHFDVTGSWWHTSTGNRSAQDRFDAYGHVSDHRKVRNRNDGRARGIHPLRRAVGAELPRRSRTPRRLLARRLGQSKERWMRQRLAHRRQVAVRFHRTAHAGGLARRAMATEPGAGNDIRGARLRIVFAFAALACSVVACSSDESDPPSSSQPDGGDAETGADAEAGVPPDTGLPDAPLQYAPGEKTLLTGDNPDDLDEDPSAVAAADGSLLIAYFSQRNGNPDIYVKRSVDGTTWTEARVTESPSADYYPSLSQDESGKFHLTWFRWTAFQVGSIWYTSSDDATSWDPAVEEQVTTLPNVDDWVPTLAKAQSGDLVICFASEKRNPSSHSELYISRKPSGAQSWLPATALTELESNTQDDTLPILSRTGDELTLVWVRCDPGGTAPCLSGSADLFSATSSDGVSFGTLQQLTSDASDTTADTLPSMYVDHSGVWRTLWISAAAGQSGASVESPLSPFAPVMRPEIEGYSPHAVATPTPGVFLGVWVEQVPNFPDQKDVYYRLFSK